jgi:hypothetical protein
VVAVVVVQRQPQPAQPVAVVITVVPVADLLHQPGPVTRALVVPETKVVLVAVLVVHAR